MRPMNFLQKVGVPFFTMSLLAASISTASTAIAAETATPLNSDTPLSSDTPINSAMQTGSLPTIVVTASSNALNLRDAPASISVISREEIERQPVASLADLLKKVPGVTGGLSANGDGSKIKLRGLPDNYTLILIDGKRQGSSRDTSYRPDLGRQDLNWLTPDMIERIEVVRGPMSSLYGSDAMGGVINIITRKIPNHWGGNVSLNYTQPTTSSDRGMTTQMGAMLAGPLADNLGLRLTAGRTERKADKNYKTYSVRGQPDSSYVSGTTGHRDDNFGALLNLKLNPDHNFSVEAKYGVQEALESTGVTMNGTPDQEDVWGSEELKHQSYNATWDADWGFATSKLAAYYNDYDQKMSLGTAASNQTVIEGSMNIPFTALFEHQLSVGGQWKRDELNNTDTIGSILDWTGDETTNPNYGKPLPSYDGTNYNGKSKVEGKTWAVFLEDNISITDDFIVTVGNRLDHDEKYGTNNSPRIYGVYHPFADWTVRGGVARGFRAPTVKESTAGAATQSGGNGCNSLKGKTYVDENNQPHIYTSGSCYMAGNADLQPEESTNYEIGLSYDGFGSDIGLTYFHTDFKNKIDYYPLGFFHGTWWTKLENAQKARTKGFEAVVNVPLMDNLKWNNSATYFLEAKNLQTQAALINTPKITINSSLNWQVSDSVNLDFAAEHVGKQYSTASTAATTMQKPYTIFGFAANYDYNDYLTLRAGLNNVFDKQLARSSSSYYLERQAAFVGLTAKY